MSSNLGIAFIGTTKGGDFDITEGEAIPLLSQAGNPNGKPNSDVLKPILNGQDVLRRGEQRWLIDNGEMPVEEASRYEVPHGLVVERVKPSRDTNRDKWLRENWWKLQRVRPEMRAALARVGRFIALPRVAKHRVCVWFRWPVVTDDQTVVFARDDDAFIGVLQSRFHQVWAFAQGTQLRERESGFRYRPTTCFETFPFPFADDLRQSAAAPEPLTPAPDSEPSDPNGSWGKVMATRFYKVREEPPAYGGSRRREDAPASQLAVGNRLLEMAQRRAAIAAAAQELNALRERWLNPPEWTRTEFLEFPATVTGPWARYLVPSSILGPQSPLGLARYPRLVPKDSACAAKLKDRTLTKLYNERPAWLALAHQRLDSAVAAAYGWPADLTDEQILERLLALNLARAVEEAQAAQAKKPMTARAKSGEEML